MYQEKWENSYLKINQVKTSTVHFPHTTPFYSISRISKNLLGPLSLNPLTHLVADPGFHQGFFSLHFSGILLMIYSRVMYVKLQNFTRVLALLQGSCIFSYKICIIPPFLMPCLQKFHLTYILQYPCFYLKKKLGNFINAVLLQRFVVFFWICL